jgi:methyl-accepting chemotaxis protein
MNQSSISRQNALIEALNRVQAIIEFDLQGNILHANELFLSTMGYTLDEVVGQHHKIFCEPAYVNGIGYSQFWSKLAKGETYSGEFHRYGKDGKTVWLHASYNPIMGDDGKPARIVKFATDITAEKLRRANDEGKINAIDRAQAVSNFLLMAECWRRIRIFCRFLATTSNR